MTYSTNGLIQTTDYNGLVGASPSSTTNTLNTVWAVGSSTAGYGQSALSQVTSGDVIYASNWANLINSTANAGSHQGSSLTSVTAPVSGGTVTYLGAVPTNLSTIYSNKLNAAAKGSTISNTTTRGTTWNSQLIFTHTVTFASGDAARYFFNAGGQLKITMSSPAGTSATGLFSSLATACGTVVQSAPSSGSATIAGVVYNGVNKIGGTGSATVNTNYGYYALTTSNTQIFTQSQSSYGYGARTGTIAVGVRSNGTQGSNQDHGSVITITTTWSEVPAGSIVTAGSATTVTLSPPATTYLPQGASWGTPTVSGTVSGS